MKMPTYVVKLATGRFLGSNNRGTISLMDAQRFPSRMAALGTILKIGHESGSGAEILAYEAALMAQTALQGAGASGEGKPSPEGQNAPSEARKAGNGH